MKDGNVIVTFKEGKTLSDWAVSLSKDCFGVHQLGKEV